MIVGRLLNRKDVLLKEYLGIVTMSNEEFTKFARNMVPEKLRRCAFIVENQKFYLVQLILESSEISLKDKQDFVKKMLKGLKPSGIINEFTELREEDLNFTSNLTKRLNNKEFVKSVKLRYKLDSVGNVIEV